MSSYDNDIDPCDGEMILSVISPSGIEYQLRALTIGGCPFYYATVRKSELDPDGFLIWEDVNPCYSNEGLWVWDHLQAGIEAIKKWR